MRVPGGWRTWSRGVFVSCLMQAVLAAAPPAALRDTPPAGRSSPIVVAELFTSEGCSSCPPADDLLRALVGGALMPDIHVIGLSEHVDYWDQLGWRDPFSSVLFADRQTDYNDHVFHLSSIYTPQLVIDGRRAMVGSDRAEVLANIRAAARVPKTILHVQATRAADGRALTVTIRSSAPASTRPIDLRVAVIEDGLSSQVTRGENGGRVLAHAAVTRALVAAGRWAAQGAAGQRVTIPWQPSWTAAHLSVVGLLQERSSRHIVGAGVGRLSE